MQKGSGTSSDHFLHLSEKCINFEPLNKVTKVFYDHSGQQVFAVRSGGATGVVVKGWNESRNHAFRMEDKGLLLSIKLSLDQKILSLQWERNSVDFHYLEFKGEEDVLPEKILTQKCKSKGGILRGFVWSADREILFITDGGIELYQLTMAVKGKETCKLVKSFSISTLLWFIHHPPLSFLLCYSPPAFHSFLVSSLPKTTSYFSTPTTGVTGGGGGLMKLPKLDMTSQINVPPGHGSLSPSGLTSSLVASDSRLSELDVTVGDIYGQIAVLVLSGALQSQAGGVSISTSSSTNLQVHVYLFSRDYVSVRWRHILVLDISNCLAVNIIDSLVIVHHQSSRLSMIFDVGLPGDSDGYLQYHRPLSLPLSIRPATVASPQSSEIVHVPHYSMNWVVRQPDIIIDAKLGCLWKLELELDGVIRHMKDPLRVAAFLITRSLESKSLLLQELRRMIETGSVPLLELGKIFDLLNDICRRRVEVVLARSPRVMREPPAALVAGSMTPPVPSCSGELTSELVEIENMKKLLVEQSDLYNYVFSPAFRYADDASTESSSNSRIDRGRLAFPHKALLEYIRSLTRIQMPVHYYMFELLLNGLIKKGAFYQMDQLLHYKVIPDSKPMACLLLSLSKLYPPAQQTALDMLHRLGTAVEEIVEVLLETGHVIPALRFLRSEVDILEPIWKRKFLDAASSSTDPMTVHAVKVFFDPDSPPLIKL